MKIAVILGTRPEIIKMSPVIRELQKRDIPFFVLHTGQHYSHNLDGVFFEQLNLPQPELNLHVGSGSHAEETGKMLIGIEKALLESQPGVVLVEGDTNSVLAGALAAAKLNIKVGHVEAGLRSNDRSMPEEVNRVLADHLSDYLFAPTPGAKEALLKEGLPDERVFVTGNTIVDAVQQNLELARSKARALEEFGLEPRSYFLATVHRQENVDDAGRFRGILAGLRKLGEVFEMPVVYPIHPRAAKRMNEFGLDPEPVRLVEPLDYLRFLELEANARLVLSDSGGVQEETCILGVPCVTVRDNTERPETVEAGSNVLAGADPDRILECSRTMLSRQGGWQNPFGDGQAAKKIVNALLEDGNG